MLYTVVPLEKIYRYKNYDYRRENTQDQVIDQYKQITIDHGRVTLERHEADYIVTNLTSTDMKDYLNEKYTPGSIMGL